MFVYVVRVKIYKKIFDLYIYYIFEVFVVFGFNMEFIDVIGKLIELDFLIKIVENLKSKIFYLKLVVGVGLLC